MLWFKHKTDAHTNQKIAALEAEAGLEGLGFWWRIMEIVGGNLDEKSQTFCCYPAKVWANFAGISVKKFLNLAEILKKNKLILLKNDRNIITIDVPNILKYRDEYTERKAKKSRQYPDNVGTKSVPRARALTDTDTETDTETEKRRKDPPYPPEGGVSEPEPGPVEISSAKTVNQEPPAKPPDRPPAKPPGKAEAENADFEAFWGAYPRRQAKANARFAWRKLAKTGRLPPLPALLAAVAAQERSADWLKDGGQFIPLPASWLNAERWLDEVAAMPVNGRSERTARNIAALQQWKPPTSNIDGRNAL